MRFLRAAPAIVCFTACLGTSDPIPPDTGIAVEVALWPIDPVEIEGQPSRTRPAVGARVVARDASGDEVAAAVTDEEGSARLLLGPGRYTVSVEECPGAMSLPKEDATVDVSSGAFATATLTCDTGIR